MPLKCFNFYRNVLLPLLTVSSRYFLHHARTLISGAKREQVFVSILLFHRNRNFILLFHSSLLRHLQESIHLFSYITCKAYRYEHDWKYIYSKKRWIFTKTKKQENLLTSRYLLAQVQQWKQRNNVWNLFKVNNKDNQNNMTSFWCHYC